MFAKLSIGLLQLRVMGLSTSTLRRMHHATIALTILVSMYEFFTLLFQCYPGPEDNNSVFQPVIIATADHSCQARRAPILVSVYVYSAVNIALDWYYSLAMVPLITGLQNMKAVVKATAIVILGMGVFASIATIIRLKYLVGFADSRDPLLAIVPVGLWSWVEECLGMCAACIVTFRPLTRLIPGTDRSGSTGGGSGDDGGLFVTWRSRLDCVADGEKGMGRRGRKKGTGGPDGVGMEVLEDEDEEEDEEEEWDDGVGDEECGGRRAARARAGTKTDPGVGGGVVEYVSDVDDGGGDVAVRSDNRFHHHHDGIDDGTTTIMTTRTTSSGGKDNVDVQTVLSDADSQKSFLQQKSADSWRA
ncbi:hypothetical protein SLS55_008380 [Diplodia seriata]|uniref:Rhodopsin domain-containing protein n=1 Tax=Diplodia seriata TaxID=420778 RepID=A0ABR3CBA1_9PEZI